MGDFLSNLTARTFQPLAQVQPRLPTRFEPALDLLLEPSPALLPAGLSEVAASSPDQAQPTQPEPAAEWPVAQAKRATYAPTLPFDQRGQRAPLPAPKPAVAATPAADLSPPIGPGPAQPAQPAPESWLEQAEPAAQPIADGQHSRLAPPPAAWPAPLPTPAQAKRLPQLANRPGPIPLAAPAAALALLQQRPAQPALLPVSHGSNRPATLPAVAQPPRARPSSRPRPVRDQDELDLEQAANLTLPTQSAAPANPVAKVSQPRPTGLLTSPGQRLASPATAARPTGEPATTTPTINVTIGRIEVRATPSATAAKPAPTKSSTLSLDDYLRRRGQGGAR